MWYWQRISSITLCSTEEDSPDLFVLDTKDVAHAGSELVHTHLPKGQTQDQDFIKGLDTLPHTARPRARGR